MIRAGRGSDGQPHPDPAQPESGQSSDPSSSKEHAATTPGLRPSENAEDAETAAPSSAVLTKDEPGSAAATNTTTKTNKPASDPAEANTEAPSPAESTTSDGRRGAVRQTLGHT